MKEFKELEDMIQKELLISIAIKKYLKKLRYQEYVKRAMKDNDKYEFVFCIKGIKVSVNFSFDTLRKYYNEENDSQDKEELNKNIINKFFVDEIKKSISQK